MRPVNNLAYIEYLSSALYFFESLSKVFCVLDDFSKVVQVLKTCQRPFICRELLKVLLWAECTLE